MKNKFINNSYYSHNNSFDQLPLNIEINNVNVRASLINTDAHSSRRSTDLSHKDYMITSMRTAMSSLRDKFRPQMSQERISQPVPPFGSTNSQSMQFLPLPPSFPPSIHQDLNHHKKSQSKPQKIITQSLSNLRTSAQNPTTFNSFFQSNPNLPVHPHKSLKQSKDERSLQKVRSSVEHILTFNKSSSSDKKGKQNQSQYSHTTQTQSNQNEVGRLQAEYGVIEQRLLEQQQVNEELKRMIMKGKVQGEGGDGEVDYESVILRQQVKELEEKLEESYRQQHTFENMIEEYEVNMKRIEENLKSNNKKFHDLQKKFSQSEQSKKDLLDKLRKMEQEKSRLSEKWIKLSTKNKQEERQRSKLRELETQNDNSQQEISNLQERINKLEKENLVLRKTTEGSTEVQQKQLNQIRKLQEENGQMEQQREMADKVTKELLQRVKKYEEEMGRVKQNQQQELRDGKEFKVQQEQMRNEMEKMSSQLRQKDQENHHLKQNFMGLQNEMIRLQTELMHLNGFSQSYLHDHSQTPISKLFQNPIISQVFTSLKDLLKYKFTSFDNTDQELLLLQQLNTENLQEEDLQNILVLCEQKLRNVFYMIFTPVQQQQQQHQQPQKKVSQEYFSYSTCSSQNEKNGEAVMNNENQNLLNTQRLQMFKCESSEFEGREKVPQFYQTQRLENQSRQGSGRNGVRQSRQQSFIPTQFTLPPQTPTYAQQINLNKDLMKNFYNSTEQLTRKMQNSTQKNSLRGSVQGSLTRESTTTTNRAQKRGSWHGERKTVAK